MNGGKEGKIDLTLKGGGGKREGGGRTQRKRERARSGSPNSPRAVAADRVVPATPTAPGWRKHRQTCEREEKQNYSTPAIRAGPTTQGEYYI